MFPDRSPAAEHHYLVITKVGRSLIRSHLKITHCFHCKQACIKDVQSLGRDDIQMVRDMEELGLRVLWEQSGHTDKSNKSEKSDKVMTGFHWPLHTVSHLHMHIIAPSDNIKFLKKLEFSRMLFGSTQAAIEMLEKKK